MLLPWVLRCIVVHLIKQLFGIWSVPLMHQFSSVNTTHWLYLLSSSLFVPMSRFSTLTTKCVRCKIFTKRIEVKSCSVAARDDDFRTSSLLICVMHFVSRCHFLLSKSFYVRSQSVTALLGNIDILTLHTD